MVILLAQYPDNGSCGQGVKGFLAEKKAPEEPGLFGSVFVIASISRT